MKQHRWHKEIKAWADGAEIEYRLPTDRWVLCDEEHPPQWLENVDYRIKPQPKEPQYLYVYKDYGIPFIREDEIESPDNGVVLLGKIKLEQDDE